MKSSISRMFGSRKSIITRGTLIQLLTACVVGFTTLTCGMILSWNTPMIPRLTNLSSDEIGWLISFLFLGGVLGTIFVASFVDYIGRKRVLWYSFIPALIFYAFSAYELTYAWRAIGQTIGGMGVGMTYTVIQMYLAEIADANIRGTIGGVPCIFRNIGNMMSYTFGSLLSPMLFSLVSSVPVILGACLFFFIPETPYQLLMLGNRKDAQKSLSWLRGGVDVTDELDTMEKYVNERQHRVSNFRELSRRKGLRVAALLTTQLILLTDFCGYQPIVTYADVIFTAADFDISGDESVIIFGGAVLATNFINFFMVDWLGRRKTLIGGSALSGALLIIAAGFFQLKSSGYDVSSFNILPLLVIPLYGTVANFGLLVVPAIVMGEIFPTNVKATAMTFILVAESALAAVSNKLFQVIQDSYGLHMVFYFYAMWTLILMAMLVILLPETKGKSFAEIENHLENLNFCTCVNSPTRINLIDTDVDQMLGKYRHSDSKKHTPQI